ncbi:hypothetical protein, partial [Xanthomonas vasicola]
LAPRLLALAVVLRIAEGQLHRRCPLRLCDCRRIKGSCSEFPKASLIHKRICSKSIAQLAKQLLDKFRSTLYPLDRDHMRRERQGSTP